MAQKPISQISYRPGKMSEESEFVLKEMYEEINNLRADLDMDKDGGPKKRILELTIQNDTLQDEINELKSLQLIMEASILKLQETIQSLTAKLDAEDVANLDNDYASLINNKMY